MRVVELPQMCGNEWRVYTMTNFQKLSKTEMEVMQIIWASDHPMTSGELLDIFARNKGKEWKGQTIATFLARLVEKGVLTSIKQGWANIYEPRMSPEEYRSQEAKSLLETLYEGSVKNFLATLYDGKELTKDEITELRRWFAEKTGDKNE
jgi:BlaI family penicillinase repressor